MITLFKVLYFNQGAITHMAVTSLTNHPLHNSHFLMATKVQLFHYTYNHERILSEHKVCHRQYAFCYFTHQQSSMTHTAKRTFLSARTMNAPGVTTPRKLIGTFTLQAARIFLDVLLAWIVVHLISAVNPQNVEMIRKCWMGHLKLLIVAGGAQVHATSTKTLHLTHKTS